MAGDRAAGRRQPGRGYREGVTERRWTGLLPARNPGEQEKYPGEKFGLPESGPRSVASMGRRLLALLIAVIPPLVTDRDLRGLHDRAANTIVLRS